MPKKSPKSPKALGVGNTEQPLNTTVNDNVNDDNTSINSDMSLISPKKRNYEKNLYFFTFNNYPADYIDSFINPLKKITKYGFVNHEVGKECKTPHLQGQISLTEKMSIVGLKKLFSNKINWRETKKEANAIVYCTKKETQVKEPITWGKIGRKLQKQIDAIIADETPDEDVIILPQGAKWKNWQNEIFKILEAPPQARRIVWVYDQVGRIGKSMMCKEITHNRKGILIDGDKKSDMINHLFNYYTNGKLNSKTPLLIDIPRAYDVANISYTLLENISNGLIVNSKYETGQACWNCGHIIVFANHAPYIHNISHDRLEIYEIDDDKDQLKLIPFAENVKNLYNISEKRLTYYLENKKRTNKFNNYLKTNMKLIVDDDDSYDSESNEFKAPFKDNNKMELSEMVEKKKSINAKLNLAYN